MIYSIGYGGYQRIEDLMSRLSENEVQMLVDVRRYPNASRDPFKPWEIEEACQKAGIHYGQRGDTLGGKPVNSDKEAVRRMLQRIEDCGSVCALLCACSRFAKCHVGYFLSPIAQEAEIEIRRI